MIKTNYLLLSLIIISFSCTSKKKVIANKELIHNNLIIEFKNNTFIKCIELGFGKNDAIRKVLNEDRSVSQDYVLGIINYRYIDTLAMNLALKIKHDSIKTNRVYQSNVEEYGNMIGKSVFSTCLAFYTSMELDSIARSRTSEISLPYMYR